jgi:hypothetical protein
MVEKTAKKVSERHCVDLLLVTRLANQKYQCPSFAATRKCSKTSLVPPMVWVNNGYRRLRTAVFGPAAL